MNRKIPMAAAAVLMLAVIICAALYAFASSAPSTHLRHSKAS